MKHTPGPWKVAPLTNKKYYGTEVIIGDNTLTVWIPGKPPVKPSEREIANGWDGDTYDHMETEECLANARLIAAAPDLLEALQELTDFVDYVGPTKDPSIQQALAAINKATIGEG